MGYFVQNIIKTNILMKDTTKISTVGNNHRGKLMMQQARDLVAKNDKSVI